MPLPACTAQCRRTDDCNQNLAPAQSNSTRALYTPCMIHSVEYFSHIINKPSSHRFYTARPVANTWIRFSGHSDMQPVLGLNVAAQRHCFGVNFHASVLIFCTVSSVYMRRIYIV